MNASTHSISDHKNSVPHLQPQRWDRIFAEKFNTPRRLTALMIVAVVALSVAYAPVLLDEVAGIDVSNPVFAGDQNGNGGGG